MPAAAVIPAPLAYTKVAAVKKLVVGYQLRRAVPEAFVSARQVSRGLIQEGWSGIYLFGLARP